MKIFNNSTFLVYTSIFLASLILQLSRSQAHEGMAKQDAIKLCLSSPLAQSSSNESNPSFFGISASSLVQANCNGLQTLGDEYFSEEANQFCSMFKYFPETCVFAIIKRTQTRQSSDYFYVSDFEFLTRYFRPGRENELKMIKRMESYDRRTNWMERNSRFNF